MKNGKEMDQFLEISSNLNFREFYNQLIRHFEDEGNFFTLREIDQRKIDIRLSNFKGVTVFWRGDRINFENATSHSAWNPFKRWTPNMISLRYKKIGLGFKSDKAIKELFSIDMGEKGKEPTPESAVINLLKEKHGKPFVTAEVIRNYTSGKKKQLIRNRLNHREIEELFSKDNSLYDKHLDFEDATVDFFDIDEHISYSPLMFKNIILKTSKKGAS